MTSTATKMTTATATAKRAGGSAPDRGSGTPRVRFDGETLIALELLLAVIVAEATIIFHAALSAADVGALYITVT
jgi:hypothetical protein